MTCESDEALVVASRRGDRAAFEELVRRCARLLYVHLYVKTTDVHRAEDLVQETLLLAWRSVSKLEDPKTFRAWLTRIADRALVDSARRAARKKRRWGLRAKQTELDAAADPQPGPADAAQTAEQRGRVLIILQNLPQDYRDPLMLRYLAGADYDTIGRQLALSNGSLRGLLHRGMKMLREKMMDGETGTQETERRRDEETERRRDEET